MKASEILELVRAGYTKEEIASMDEAAAPAGNQEDPEPVTDPEQTETKPEPEQQPSQVEQLMKAFGMKIDGLTKAIQSSNIKTAEGSTPSVTDVDTILAKIINPHYAEKEA